MDYCDIVVYWGYGQIDPVWSLLLMLRPWMGHGYIVIQVVHWVELLEQRRLYSIFVKIWIPINGTQQCGIELSKIHRNSAGWQRDSQVLGSHTGDVATLERHNVGLMKMDTSTDLNVAKLGRSDVGARLSILLLHASI